MSVVYYGNYLTYFEVGRVEYLRRRNLPMSEVDKRVHMPVVEAFVKYSSPPSSTTSSRSARGSASASGRASRSRNEIRNEAKELVATGFTRHACWDPGHGEDDPRCPTGSRRSCPDADLDPTDR